MGASSSAPVGVNEPETAKLELVVSIRLRGTLELTSVASLEQTPFVSCAGEQMKKSTVPVGAGAPPMTDVPVTVAASVTDWPRGTVVTF